jgi:hypothetical protein
MAKNNLRPQCTKITKGAKNQDIPVHICGCKSCGTEMPKIRPAASRAISRVSSKPNRTKNKQTCRRYTSHFSFGFI